MKSERMYLLISGQVQGVGYRASLRREAVARHVSGWVRNLPDGRVDYHFQRCSQRGPFESRV